MFDRFDFRQVLFPMALVPGLCTFVAQGFCDEELVVKDVIDEVCLQLNDGRTVKYLGLSPVHWIDGARQTGLLKRLKERHRAMARGKKVRLVPPGGASGDRHGYLVFSGDCLLNEEVLRVGLAVFAYKQRGLLSQRLYAFLEAQEEAGRLRRGVWSLPELNETIVGSRRSGKAHHLYCKWGALIRPKNRWTSRSLRSALNMGFKPCKRCLAGEARDALGQGRVSGRRWLGSILLLVGLGFLGRCLYPRLRMKFLPVAGTREKEVATGQGKQGSLTSGRNSAVTAERVQELVGTSHALWRSYLGRRDVRWVSLILRPPEDFCLDIDIAEDAVKVAIVRALGIFQDAGGDGLSLYSRCEAADSGLVLALRAFGTGGDVGSGLEALFKELEGTGVLVRASQGWMARDSVGGNDDGKDLFLELELVFPRARGN